MKGSRGKFPEIPERIQQELPRNSYYFLGGILERVLKEILGDINEEI